MRRIICSMGLNSSTVLGKSSSPLRDWNQYSSVRRYLVLSLASVRAVNTSRHRRAKVVQYVLLDWSRARNTRRMRGPCSCSKMLLRLLALLRQKSISTSGVGCMPCLSWDSGSCFNTLRICFVQVIMAPSNREMRFLPVDGPPLRSMGGMGSLVSPLICPHRIVVLERKLWKRSMISRVGTSPHFAWFCGLESTGRKISLARSSRCSKGFEPNSRTAISLWIFSIDNVQFCSFTKSSTLPLVDLEGITKSIFMLSGTTRQRFWSSSQKWTIISLISSVRRSLSSLGPASLGKPDAMRSLM
mmetsp:Transcript_61979/g.109050  ORF Transcript_61979/g.109050 Transcript_61979/m.109050 type:complete len:300 (+) Transcript_61979:31-930(+)